MIFTATYSLGAGTQPEEEDDEDDGDSMNGNGCLANTTRRLKSSRPQSCSSVDGESMDE